MYTSACMFIRTYLLYEEGCASMRRTHIHMTVRQCVDGVYVCECVLRHCTHITHFPAVRGQKDNRLFIDHGIVCTIAT